MKVLLVGSGAEGARLLELLGEIESVELLAVLGTEAHGRTRQMARELLTPYETEIEALARYEDVELIINASENPNIDAYLQLHKPKGAELLDGRGLDLVLELTGRLLRLRGEAGKYRVARLGQEQEGGPRIIGKSEAMDEVRELIRRVAPTPTTVLLLGETGTGKDLAARTIHQQSQLRDKPFVPVNCTALTASLMESELFGYKKGAFTGAEQDRRGLLEEADGGALFLDEIGDMQVELQAKLLRFLQTGEIRRVGSTRSRTVAVRVIAATNRNLEEAVERGEFRRDLFYRFNAFSIKLPPLRERSGDVPYLAWHFLTKAEAKLNKHVQGIDDKALEALSGYAWPGNVRELENVMERAVILCQGESVGVADLALPARGPVLETARPAAPAGAFAARTPAAPADAFSAPPQTAPAVEGDFHEARRQVVDDFERRELLNYLKDADGNVSEACRRSGIPRRTFYRLMRRHGL